MDPINIQQLYAALQEAALPNVWTKGIALAKDGIVFESSRSPEEILLKINRPNQAVSPKVTLWPTEMDWHCDCGDRNDPCVHAVAAATAFKNGLTKQEALVGKTKTSKKATTAAPSGPPRIDYRFYRQSGYLNFDRYLVSGTKEVKLNQSLVAYIGGIQSGRITGQAPIATKEDYAIDHVLGGSHSNPLDRYTLTRLLAAIKGHPAVTFEEKPVEISAQTVSPQARLIDDKGGFKFELVNDSNVGYAFKNGAVLCGNTLKAVREPAFSTKEREAFGHIPAKDIQRFASTILPGLEAKMVVRIETQKAPRLKKFPPRLVLHLQAETQDRLSVYPQMFYGNPPIAEVRGSEMIVESMEIPERDLVEEERLVKRLHSELQLQVGRQSHYEGESALLFVSKLNSWETTGNGLNSFRVEGELIPNMEVGEGEFNLGFTANGGRASANSVDVLAAWKNNRSFVPLANGGWGSLPQDWLLKYADRAEALLNARKATEKLPNYLLPEAASLCEDSGQAISEKLKDLRDSLMKLERIPHVPLPKDLKADLRLYQKRGVDWLCFLRKLGMGALLADDMGLGKTLQSIACLDGKTLVICPTSVLQSWADQISDFRPGLKYTIYHGASRTIDADVVLTSYGVYRIEQDKLCEMPWDTVILDEAQTIKNPDSQIAKAAHRLRGNFRIALSGTPIENNLDDLWSQFHFLNPGLLGTREEFNRLYGEAIRSGSERRLERLRTKIRPFILRRLKKDVAPELPARTEIVLHCDLNEQEQSLYNGVLAASRKEVLEKLDSGSVMAALEMLLRLRQSCCHGSMVPGSGLDANFGSAKLELFMEILQESLSHNHKALVFSQWTSLLDLVEPRLNALGIKFIRLDGSSKNRETIVSTFQKDDGPPVMLISLKAGGVGITLTAADHVFILDPWWNPATEDQAADRAHRIGQLNPVFIHRLVARNTVEDRILQLQKKKRALAGSLLSGSGDTAELTKDDIRSLLL